MKTFTFNQTEASDEWVINHNMGGYPISEVIIDREVGRQEIFPLRVEYVNANTLRILFSVPYTGVARLIATGVWPMDLNVTPSESPEV